MTTYVRFQPSATSVFQFQATLDGSSYTVSVPWSLFGQRFYVQIVDQNQSLVVLLPLVGSPANYNISMTAGYFKSTLVYRTSTGNFEISS